MVTIPCDVCAEQIDISNEPEPGQVTVVTCSNCETSWTVWNPPLEIYRTKELPDHLADVVWSKLSDMAESERKED